MNLINKIKAWLSIPRIGQLCNLYGICNRPSSLLLEPLENKTMSAKEFRNKIYSQFIGIDNVRFLVTEEDVFVLLDWYKKGEHSVAKIMLTKNGVTAIGFLVLDLVTIVPAKC